jgi:hypothetical protein
MVDEYVFAYLDMYNTGEHAQQERERLDTQAQLHLPLYA